MVWATNGCKWPSYLFLGHSPNPVFSAGRICLCVLFAAHACARWGFTCVAALTVATSGWLLGPHGRSAKGPKAAATRLAAQPGGGRA